MKTRMELIAYLSQMLENNIRNIKFGHQFLTMVNLEGIFLIRLQSKKYLVSFKKLMFKVTMIYMVLHAILDHDQILFKGTKNRLLSYKHLAHHLDLRDTW
jgi:ABC-type siderophore export system fused ATPase/permease subunit